MINRCCSSVLLIGVIGVVIVVVVVVEVVVAMVVIGGRGGVDVVLWDRSGVPVVRWRGTDCCCAGKWGRDAEVVGWVAEADLRRHRGIVLGGRVRVRRGFAVGKPVSVLSFRE